MSVKPAPAGVCWFQFGGDATWTLAAINLHQGCRPRQIGHAWFYFRSAHSRQRPGYCSIDEVGPDDDHLADELRQRSEFTATGFRARGGEVEKVHEQPVNVQLAHTRLIVWSRATGTLRPRGPSSPRFSDLAAGFRSITSPCSTLRWRTPDPLLIFHPHLRLHF